jgi:glycosyltransferase involved in cell wall biosynthesis
MNKPLSVVLCTHNPRIDYLNQVLSALVNQTLATEHWEFVVIDNASQERLSQRADLNLPDFCRVIVEPQLGLTPARIRGIRETSGAIILFVDDDNLLALDYLEQLIKLHQQHPQIGVWSGNIAPIFESPPASSTQRYWEYLALRQVDREIWSNLPDSAPLPCGAGMSVRREVALHYCTDTITNPLRFMLDRKGKSLLAGGDTDIGLAACDLGFGVGSSPNLKVQHLIPAERLQRSYLNQLVESITYSHQLLYLVRNMTRVSRRQIVFWKLADSLYPLFTAKPYEFSKYRRRGFLRAHVDYLRYKASGVSPTEQSSPMSAIAAALLISPAHL